MRYLLALLLVAPISLAQDAPPEGLVMMSAADFARLRTAYSELAQQIERQQRVIDALRERLAVGLGCV